MRQSHRLFLLTVSSGLLLLGVGCVTTIPGVPTDKEVKTNTEVKTDTEVDSSDEQSGQVDDQKFRPITPVKTTTREEWACSDTDGGNVLAVKGTTILKNNGNIATSKVDYCGDDKKVFEYYCGNGENSIESTGAACAENASCVDGACVPVAARLAQVAGVCGPDNGRLTVAPPHLELCSAGTPGEVMGNGPWTWTCVGLNGGATASCSAPKYLMSGLCGSANNTTVSVAPTANLCSRGTASAVLGVGPWTWTCAGEAGAEVASCRANIAPSAVLNITNGYCGSSHNATLIGAPTTNLCLTGTASSVTGNGPWAWTCAGSGGGTTASCTANVRIEP